MNARVLHLQRRTAAAPVTPHINVHAYVRMLLEAANSLLRDDLLIVGFHADLFSVAPSLWVHDCQWVRNLAARGMLSQPRSAGNGGRALTTPRSDAVTIDGWMPTPHTGSSSTSAST